MRINRFLASAGLGSRRACEELVLQGRVTLNGKRVETLATQVEPGDAVKVGSKLVHTQDHCYLLLNKPRGFICTRSDELGRKTIFDLLPTNRGRLFHVGRLDMESDGLIIVTNDGDFAQLLAHPTHQLEKEYEVVIDKDFDEAHGQKLIRGVMLESGRAKAERIRTIAPNKLEIVLRQGQKRQIREMLYRVGYEVKTLTRTRIGPISDRDLPLAHCRFLSSTEISSLRDAAANAGKRLVAKKPRPPAKQVMPSKKPR